MFAKRSCKFCFTRITSYEANLTNLNAGQLFHETLSMERMNEQTRKLRCQTDKLFDSGEGKLSKESQPSKKDDK